MPRPKSIVLLRYSMLSAADYLLVGVLWLPGLAGLMVALAAGGALVMQLVDYLYQGTWRSHSLFDLLIQHGGGSLQAWLVYPQGWLGLHASIVPVLRFLSAWLVLACVGLLLLMLSRLAVKRLHDPLRARRLQFHETELAAEQDRPAGSAEMETVEWVDPGPEHRL